MLEVLNTTLTYHCWLWILYRFRQKWKTTANIHIYGRQKKSSHCGAYLLFSLLLMTYIYVVMKSHLNTVPKYSCSKCCMLHFCFECFLRISIEIYLMYLTIEMSLTTALLIPYFCKGTVPKEACSSRKHALIDKLVWRAYWEVFSR